MENFTDEKAVPAVQNLDQLIAELHKVFDSDRVNVDYVKALMAAYKSNPSDWKRYAKFDDFSMSQAASYGVTGPWLASSFIGEDPERYIHNMKWYTRNLVDSGNGKFNLIALCWGEGHGSSIHDHMDAHCFMKILDGQLVETNFAWPTRSLGNETRELGSSVDGERQGEEAEGEPMIQTGCHCYKKDMVAYINDSLGLHRVENMSHVEKAVSLHLYSPPFQECHTFDERTGHKSTAKVTFWSKYGKRDIAETNGVNQCSAVTVVQNRPRATTDG